MPAISLADVLSAAQAEAGSSDFGDDYFVEPLSRMIDALNESRWAEDFDKVLPHNGLHGGGDLQNERRAIVFALVERLQMEEYFKRHPEIEERPIERPVIGVGRQRTGTSKFFGVLASEPRWNTLPYYQAIYMTPVDGEPDPRIELARAGATAATAGGYHTFDAEAPEMEALLLHRNFMSMTVARLLPSHWQWCQTADYRPAYRYLRRQLQFVQWQNDYPAGRRWLLKTPPHLLNLPSLVDAFPDAKLVMTHRHPRESVASLLRVVEVTLANSGQVLDPDVVRANWLENQVLATQRYLDFRDGPEGDRFVDVGYREVVDDAAGAVKRVYDFVGEPFTAETESCVREWERRNPQHVLGRFDYSLEQYGLTDADIDELFGEYIERYRPWL
jgi:hypothetical protein